ncbi:MULTISPECIES: hypothetical protein [unclassified Helicobacter]|nr:MULTISPECIES: hypothetical protein [unclassified Helicobacter]
MWSWLGLRGLGLCVWCGLARICGCAGLLSVKVCLMRGIYGAGLH